MSEHIETNVWQITEFAEKITESIDGSVHYNTVAKWFNKLESMGVHYVNRAVGEKIYGDLDLRIGIFIFEKRKENWRLDVIFQNLPKFIETRSFPEEWEGNTPGTDLAEVEAALFRKLNAKVQEQLEQAHKEMLKGFEQVAASSISKMLPEPKSSLEIRQEKFNNAMLQMKINNKLEEEAINKWSEQPETVRIRKVGFFRKEENYEEREKFIRNYKNQNFEYELEKELGIEDER
ncbi:hypothetical protein ACFFIX_20465 [Metabacillus herbersteinensis]|uniref:MerR family transcriptional regulator n=1 Tax=Metabacillus herbersteinensis TaxID=283816 RepID=A0ABV6GJL3_9BACI